MPRKSKKKPAATGLDPAAAVMEELNEQGADLKPASELPDPRTEAEPPARELIPEAPETSRPRPSHKLNGTEHETKGGHTAAVLASLPNFAPVAKGYRNVLRDNSAGIRVNRGVDREMGTLGTAALQFSEDRPLSRATEYDLMEMVQQAGFQYKSANRQWERPRQEGTELGDNAIDAVRLAKEIADARNVERAR